jgi:hypothetical protein
LRPARLLALICSDCHHRCQGDRHLMPRPSEKGEAHEDHPRRDPEKHWLGAP